MEFRLGYSRQRNNMKKVRQNLSKNLLKEEILEHYNLHIKKGRFQKNRSFLKT